MKHLTLSEAIKSDRLDEFAEQQEAAGNGSSNAKNFDLLIETAAKPRRSIGQTSGSSSRGDSSGK